MKILYYVTDHGLGHSSRSVALIRELERKQARVILRSNDPLGFLKKSLPSVKIISGQTDFEPVMHKDNGMVFDDKKTESNLSKWIKNMSTLAKRESSIIEKENPDLVVSDMSFFPLVVARDNDINSVLVSSFVWNESLNISPKLRKKIKEMYDTANSIISLPLGTAMKFQNSCKVGIVARRPTLSKRNVRARLNLKPNQKLVLVSLAGIRQSNLKHSDDIKLVDLSDYSSIKKIGLNIEGQNLINAADLVICKCGYGFVSECLTTGTCFCYVVNSKHKEAYNIHRYLKKLGMDNKILVNTLTSKVIDKQFIDSYKPVRKPCANHKVAQKILSF